MSDLEREKAEKQVAMAAQFQNPRLLSGVGSNGRPYAGPSERRRNLPLGVGGLTPDEVERAREERQMKCDDCKIDYPGRLVIPFRSSRRNANLCGICALDAKNLVHGTAFKKFTGEMAEQLRLDAIRWRGAMKNGGTQ